MHQHQEILKKDYLAGSDPLRILITSGASCPDAIVESVITKLAGFFEKSIGMERMIREWTIDN
jgi:4-hydroxy-3-methylbut-2-enyl diphosphate reductase